MEKVSTEKVVMDLNQIRKRIDLIDSEIIALLGKRLEFSVRTRNLKTDIQSPQREAAVKEKICAESFGLLGSDFTARIYEQIMAESRRIQESEQVLIGFQGEHGAFSEIALRAFDAHAMSIPHIDFAEVFQGLHSGVIDLAIVPVENSLGGSIREVEQELLTSEAQIRAEILLPIKHCLLALPGSDHRELRHVYSHPQALAQCRGFLERSRLEARPYYDTAGAAAMLARERPGGVAVVASELCAKLYNLEILKAGIQDAEQNYTRFFVLAPECREQDGSKCSLVFSTADKPGALVEILMEFAKAKINLTRIESRPRPEKPGQFVFFVDFLGSIKNAGVSEVLDHIKAQADLFKVLGCYNEMRL